LPGKIVVTGGQSPSKVSGRIYRWGVVNHCKGLAARPGSFARRVKLKSAAIKPWLASVLTLWSLISFGQTERPPGGPEPARIVTRYSLVSSLLNNTIHDPSAWRLLGSNNRGTTWTVLDVRTNEAFTSRSQRLTWPVKNPGAYNTYRLQIDACVSRDITLDMSVQLAEVELEGALINAASETNLQPVITASCPHPLLGLPENAFDHDPSTRWMDYGLGSSNGCWIQIRYALHSETVVTNLSQANRLTHFSADQDWLAERGPAVLSALSDASLPPRKLVGYALTSANDERNRDPRDWVLLGSNDGGEKWAVLDKRINQTFTERFQRRVFPLTNTAACRLYRLRVDSILKNGNFSQLSEIEPIYADATNDSHYSVVVGANGDNPPLEAAEMTFDGDSRTKWLSTLVDDTHTAWIQWQNIPREEAMPVITQRQINRAAGSLSMSELLKNSSPPPVTVNGYALTSANDHPERDPRDWTLEASSDDGMTWRPIDVRRGEKFDQRFQRLEFHLTNSASGQWFRLKIESVLEPTNANSVQLAGLELHCADAAAHSTVLARAQGENAPDEGVENLFGNKPNSKWLDFSGPPGSKASWIEWRYADGHGAATINLDRGPILQAPPAKHLQLRLNAVAVFVDTNAGVVGVADETGFQRFQLSPWPDHLAPGQRILLSGNLQTKGGVLRVSNARLDSVQSLPSLAGWPVGPNDAPVENFATATVTGRVEGVCYSPQYSGARVTTSNGPPISVRVVGAPFPRLPSMDCPIIVHGVVEWLMDERGERKPSVIWVASPEAITFAPKVETVDTRSPGGHNGPQWLNGISEVRKFLDNQTGTESRPAKIRGVITYIDLNLGQFYLQNGEDAILLYGQLNAGLGPSLSQEGDYVEVNADVSSFVMATSFARVLGKGGFPQPARPSWDHLMTGEYDSRWIEREGVVTAIEKHRLTLNTDGSQIIVWINDADQKALPSLSGSLVRVQGVCSPVVNARNQRLGVRLLLPSSEFVEVLNPAPEDSFRVPSVPIAAVMGMNEQTAGLPIQFVKTTGVVTCRQPHLLFIQDKDDGLRVSLSEEADVAPGDLVEAVGWPQPDGFSPKLGQAVVRRIGRGALPQAQAIDLLTTNNASDLEQQQDATRVEIEAVLIGQSVDQSVAVLNLQDVRAQQVFCAYLPLTNAEERLSFAVGSRLRLEGVFKTIRDKAPDVEQAVTSFEMYLNSPQDIVVTARPSWWTPRHILWLTAAFASVLALVLAWVGLLRNQVRQRTHDLRLKIEEVQRSEAKLGVEIIERKRLQAEADKAHSQLLDVARQAGMAEVAIGVLHNVGNVLNSVNVSKSILGDRLQKLKAANLGKVVALLREHENDLAAFLTTDAKGRQMVPYLEVLDKHMAEEQSGALEELKSLSKNIEHIKDIVSVQQNYAAYGGMSEPVQVVDLVEDALRMSASALERHDIRTIRQFEPDAPVITTDKHKILQILVNLIRNAKQACDESGRSDKQLVVRVFNDNGSVKISATDNGIGIPPENLTRIFRHGFTTRKDGHGFGLHNSALAAKELGGILHVSSPGPGQGATFTLELPADLQNN
jgi:signal transduction histidine kinase